MQRSLGLQPERSLLAWRRTCLAFGGASAVAARFLVDEFRAGALAIGLVGVAFSAGAYFAGDAHYHRRIEALSDRHRLVGGGVHIGLLACSAAILGVAGAAYLFLRAGPNG